MLRRYVSALALAGAVYAMNGSITDYAPLVNQPCPDLTTADPLLRVFTPKNQSLHPHEEEYVNTRLTTVIPNEWENWIGDGSAIGYNLSSFNRSGFPKIGIAVSGGGYRAAQYGAGVLSALDARNGSAKAAGTGGFLQVTSYLSGLSGGSWLIGSLYMNDFPTIKDLVLGNGGNMTGWLLDIPLATPGGSNVFSKENQYWYGSILSSVFAKASAGLNTSLTDPWSRMISYHFLNQTSRANFFTNDSAHGAGQLLSDVPSISSWQQHLVPFPIIQADSRPVGSDLTTAVDPSSTVYEMTPMEFGSWDPQLSAMVNITYVGTHLTNGLPDNSTACTTFFDQVGFILGTSANFFNEILDRVHNTIQGMDKSSAKAILLIVDRMLEALLSRTDNVANWPNPFYNLAGKQNFQDLNATSLELIDGSSNLENVALGQQFVRSRGLDVVVALDSTADIAKTGWPNGTSILMSASRITTLLQSSHQSFPPLPGNAADFISTGVNMRPTFFGCFPTQNPPEYPIVVYLPNSPPLNGDKPVANTNTFQFDYMQEYTELFLDQVHANAIGGFMPNTSSPDPNFGKCMQCVAIDRARYKMNPPLERSSFCAQCFQQYCFDPNNLTNMSELPGRRLGSANQDPLGISLVLSFLSRHRIAIILGFFALFLLIAALCVFLVRRERRAREAEYQEVNVLHGADEPLFFHHGYRDSSISEMPPDSELTNLPDIPYVLEERPR